MKLEIYTSGTTENIVEKMRRELEGKGFIFSEQDKSFVVRYPAGEATKTLTYSRFWARKQLDSPHPSSFSVEVEGEVALNTADGVIVRAEFFENHANRRHGTEGSRAIDEYVDLFCNILRPQ